MVKALESVFAVLIMVGVGFVLAKRRRISAEASSLISRIVISVALPSYMIANLMGGYDRAKLLEMLPGLPIPVITMLTCFALGGIIAVIGHIPRGQRGTFATMFALSNTVFIGLPVNLVLFGEASLPYILLYYITNTVVFWTVGAYGIASDGATRSGGPSPKVVSRDGLRRVLSPPLVAFLLAVALIMAQFSLPPFILGVAHTVGNMTTPLSMLFIGITIASIDWKLVKPRIDMALLLLGRFIIAPTVLVLLVHWTALPLLMKKVFLIQASMPAMTQVPIVARGFGADAEYAGLMASITTVASLATIPIYMALIGYLF